MRLGHKGFALGWIMILTAVIPAAILTINHLVSAQRTFARSSSTSLSKMTLQTGVMRLKAMSSDADSDGVVEPYAPSGADGLPLAAGVASRDEWGTELRYCAWDLGAANANATYSTNNVAPPVANLTFRLISAGPDKAFATACADATASGDDLHLDSLQAEVVAGNSGWVQDGNSTPKAVRLLDTSYLVQVPKLQFNPMAQPDPAESLFYYDSTSHYPRFFNGAIWINLDGHATYAP